MRIGELARRSKVSTRALRYYEEQGILRSERTPSGQRIYADSAVDRVRLIQHFYAAGLGSRTIATILPGAEPAARVPGRSLRRRALHAVTGARRSRRSRRRTAPPRR
ncbi:MerR family transcriptional regulator [Streptosporangium sp. NPDC002544]|uniref:MerR family transcriptional regulator n=1 Tax=Streptosporangium sp. NPDC002544 TaxID=3154538 RepID=UPI00333405BE